MPSHGCKDVTHIFTLHLGYILITQTHRWNKIVYYSTYTRNLPIIYTNYTINRVMNKYLT